MSPIPIVLIQTDTHSRGGDTRRPQGGSMHLQTYHLQQRLQSVNAHIIAFNPVAITKMREAIARIVSETKVHVGSNTISQLAEAANGDVRHATSMLQWYILPGSRRKESEGGKATTERKGKSKKKEKRKRDDDPDIDVALVASEACDSVLTIHHVVVRPSILP